MILVLCITISVDLAVLTFLQYCSEAAVSNKNRYSTFARSRSTDSTVATAVVKLLKTYNWNKVALVSNYFNLRGEDWTLLQEELKQVVIWTGRDKLQEMGTYRPSTSHVVFNFKRSWKLNTCEMNWSLLLINLIFTQMSWRICGHYSLNPI